MNYDFLDMYVQHMTAKAQGKKRAADTEEPKAKKARTEPTVSDGSAENKEDAANLNEEEKAKDSVEDMDTIMGDAGDKAKETSDCVEAGTQEEIDHQNTPSKSKFAIELDPLKVEDDCLEGQRFFTMGCQKGKVAEEVQKCKGIIEAELNPDVDVIVADKRYPKITTHMKECPKVEFLFLQDFKEHVEGFEQKKQNRIDKMKTRT